MRIVDETYFNQFIEKIGNQISQSVSRFDSSNLILDLGYQTISSAVFSSNIEGNSLDLNSFMNYKLSSEKLKRTKDVEEIENLILAYNYAQNHPLDESGFLHCHKLCSPTLLIKSKQGKYRNTKVGVFGSAGLVYLAVEEEFVAQEIKSLFEDVNSLLSTDLSIEKVFYHASLLHLKFVHIHPFSDGNGRMARLLEKWFVAQKLGVQFWKMPSERYYRTNQSHYYENINLGVNYYELNYNRCIPFLLMLPNCLEEID
ncbi:MAG: Fic family protein [Bacteroidales bacterium]